MNKKLREKLEDRAYSGAAAYPEKEREPLQENIVDLMADLLHLANLRGLDVDYVLRMSRTHFDAEVLGEL